MAKRFKLSSADFSSGIMVPILIVAIGVVAYFLVWAKYKDLQDTRTNLAQEQAKVTLRESELSSVQTLIADFEAKKADLQVLDEALPEAPQIPELLANFDALTKQSGLFLTSVNLQPVLTDASAVQIGTPTVPRLSVLPSPQGKNMGIIQASLSLKGAYVNLKTFFAGLEQNLRIMNVQSVQIKSTSEEHPETKDITIVLQVYYQKKLN
jgi:Tfp pilus assembly protein PilO